MSTMTVTEYVISLMIADEDPKTIKELALRWNSYKEKPLPDDLIISMSETLMQSFAGCDKDELRSIF